MQQLIVRGAPQEYECRVGAWQNLEEHLLKRNINNVLILHGKDSWEAAKTYFPQLTAVTSHFEYYGGDCTDKKTIFFSQLIQQENIEGVVAVGGGKVADLGKAIANKTQVPICILPTLAATCAAYTPLSVVYFEDGAMDRYDVFNRANALVLVEPEVILHSPIELMVAGIGDTLAKWYEAEPIIAQLAVKPIEIQVAEFAAKKCRDVLLTDSADALLAMKKQTLTPAFLNVLETNILLAGMVGGYGDDFGRTSGAHSLHDALTILPNSHKHLHGNKVAYCILVQLVIENKFAEIEQLLPFYQQLNLPISLKAMNLHLTDEDYQRIAERASLPRETIHLLKETITPEVIVSAMKKLEAITN
ncbi:MAG TPA: iron-containing alcohol dehydrogenase family protein [Enterococcus sp.]|nr:iron-containing alcohol dehydrogenase family protein [Enterococcus sp.]HPR81376.1 iron-containing alcohol dehydrogenase family protein [Enterococcus sp.]